MTWQEGKLSCHHNVIFRTRDELCKSFIHQTYQKSIIAVDSNNLNAKKRFKCNHDHSRNYIRTLTFFRTMHVIKKILPNNDRLNNHDNNNSKSEKVTLTTGLTRKQQQQKSIENTLP